MEFTTLLVIPVGGAPSSPLGGALKLVRIAFAYRMASPAQ
jgi:hypothetical protein